MIEQADNATGADGATAPSVLERAQRCTLKAAALAKKLGRKKRIILLWAERGCPHYVGDYRGNPCLYFSEGEVKEWLKGQGLDENKADVRDEGAAPAGGPPPAEQAFKTWFEEQLKERAAALMGEIDYDGAIGRAQLHLQELLSTSPPPGADVGWARQWAGEFVKVSQQLVTLDQERHEVRKRRSQVIDRRSAVNFAAAMAADFAGELDALAMEISRELASRLADAIPADRLDTSRRAIQAVVQEKTNGCRAKRAAAIREWVTGIGAELPQAVAA